MIEERLQEYERLAAHAQRIAMRQMAELNAKILAVLALAPMPLEFPRAKTTYCAGFNDALAEVRAVLIGGEAVRAEEEAK